LLVMTFMAQVGAQANAPIDTDYETIGDLKPNYVFNDAVHTYIDIAGPIEVFVDGASMPTTLERVSGYWRLSGVSNRLTIKRAGVTGILRRRSTQNTTAQAHSPAVVQPVALTATSAASSDLRPDVKQLHTKVDEIRAMLNAVLAQINTLTNKTVMGATSGHSHNISKPQEPIAVASNQLPMQPHTPQVQADRPAPVIRPTATNAAAEVQVHNPFGQANAATKPTNAQPTSAEEQTVNRKAAASIIAAPASTAKPTAADESKPAADTASAALRMETAMPLLSMRVPPDTLLSEAVESFVKNQGYSLDWTPGTGDHRVHTGFTFDGRTMLAVLDRVAAKFKVNIVVHQGNQTVSVGR
jgi:hypothetical protein